MQSLARPLKKYTRKGGWSMGGGTLRSEAKQICQLEIPYQPPAEYDLELVVMRTSGDNSIKIGVPLGARRTTLVIDGYAGKYTGLATIDGQDFNENASTWRGRALENNRDYRIQVRVRTNSIHVLFDDRIVIAWAGDASRLSFHTQMDFMDILDRNVPALSTTDGSGFAIGKFTLTPVAAGGKTVRKK